MPWYTSITDMIRAGIEQGHIPKGWVTAVQRCRTFMDYRRNNVPHPHEWSEQRVVQNRIEYRPHWDLFRKGIEMPPLPSVQPPQQSQNQGRKR